MDAQKPTAKDQRGSRQDARAREQAAAHEQRRRMMREEVSARVRSTTADQVIGLFGLGEGKKGGPGWTKYGMPDGTHMNIKKADCSFSILEKTPIHQLTDATGKPRFGGRGPVDLFIALASLHGSCPADPKAASSHAFKTLRETFHRDTLSPNYRPGSFKVPERKAAQVVAEPPRPCELPPYHEEVRGKMEKYLVETRGLPPRLVKHVIDSRIAYPSVQENRIVKADGKERSWKSMVMIFPYLHLTERFATGFEHKEIPRDFVSKTLGISSGPKEESAFLLGPLDQSTKTVKICEAPIDAISKWALDKPVPGTCIVATIGVRLIPLLLRRAKEVGATVVIAVDCDKAGHRVARETAKECIKLGIPFAYDVPKESEATIVIPKNEKAEKRMAQMVAHYGKLALPLKQEAVKEGDKEFRFIGANTLETWDLFASWGDEDRLDENSPLLTEEARKTMRARPKFSVAVYRNKDWNDILKGSKPRQLDWAMPRPSEAAPATATKKSSDATPAVEV